MMAAQATAPPPANNKMIITTPAHQEREKHKCPTPKKMCLHKMKNFPETNAKKRWTNWKSCI